MSKIQKDSAVDTLVQQHPIIKKIKLEAKKLQKNSQDLSLMQAQSLVAQKEGFNSWHDLMQKIKNIFNQDFKYNSLINSENTKIPKDGFFHLGKSLDYGLEQWINRDAARTHTAIFEHQSNINSMDVYLAEQTLIKQQPLFFMSEDKESSEHLIELAKKLKLDNIVLFDLDKQLSQYSEYTHWYLSLDHMLSGSLSEFILTLCSVNLPHHQEMFKGQLINFLHTIIPIAVYLRDFHFQAFNLNDLIHYGKKETLTHLLILYEFPEHIKKTIIKYLDNTSINDEIFNELYLKPIHDFIQYLNPILASQENSKAFNFSDLLDKSSDDKPVLIIVLLPKSVIVNHVVTECDNNLKIKYFQSIFLSYLKCYISDPYGNSIDTILINENNKRKKLTSFIIRNIVPIHGFAVFPAQARSLGCALIFTFDHYYNFYQNKTEIDSIMANCNLLLWGRVQYYSGAITLFLNQMGNSLIHSQQKILTIKYRETDLHDIEYNEYILCFKNQFQKLKMIKKIFN